MDSFDPLLVLGLVGHGPAIVLLHHAHDGQSGSSGLRPVFRHTLLPNAFQHAIAYAGGHRRRRTGSDDDATVAAVSRRQHDKSRVQHLLVEAAENKLKRFRVLWNATVAGEVDHILGIERIARRKWKARVVPLLCFHRGDSSVAMKNA